MCTEIPNIHLSLDSEKGHYVKCNSCRYCYCCSNPKSKTLEAYICIMAKIQQDNIKCDIHKEKGVDEEGYFSCEYCQQWMCEECINKHIKSKEKHRYYIIRKAPHDDLHTHCPQHNLEEYKYYVTEDFMLGFHCCKFCQIDDDDPDMDVIRIPIEKGECYVNQLKEIIKNGAEYLDKYCKNIYGHLIKSINGDPDLITKANEIYDNFLIRNRRALFYYQMAINAATPSVANHNLIDNIESLLNTNFAKIKIPLLKPFNKEEIDIVLKFFEKNYIVGREVIEVEDVKEFQIKEINTIKKEIDKPKEIEEEKKDKKDEEKEKGKDDEKKN